VAKGTQSIGRFAAFARTPAIIILCGMVASGCSSPRTASGTLEEGKQRVTELVLDAAHALPADTKFTPPTLVGAQVCRKSLAGFGAGTTGAHRAQVPLIVYPAADTPAEPLLADIEAAWKRSGYRIDRSRLHEDRFPQVRATTSDGFQVVATAFGQPPKPAPVIKPQIDLYAVSQCLRGS
jgi:hypothetical protein